MSRYTADFLYTLLPAEYRIRDAQEGHVLRALVEVIAEQVQVVEDDIDRLYENLFVETAQEWVLPYIGDLVGSVPLLGHGHRTRSDVARTVSYRRRKGTLPMLEEMAAAVTGWDARVRDFFQTVSWTQNLNHLRMEALRTPEFRRTDLLERLDGPFDAVSHTANVRGPCSPESRHGLPTVGFFLWRLGTYPMVNATPSPEGSNEAYHFSPLGHPAPLYHHPLPGADRERPVAESAVRGPIRPAAFREQTDRYYGEGLSVSIVKDGVPVPAGAVLARDLSTWFPPPPGKVAVDVALGRFRFACGEGSDDVRVSFAYGFSHDLGGGPYPRSAPADEMPPTYTVGPGGSFSTLAEALSHWEANGPSDCVIEISDSDTYTDPIGFTPPEDGHLIIRSARGQRPLFRLPDSNKNIVIREVRPEAAVELVGLTVEGGIWVSGCVGHLRIAHCTLVPGRRRTGDGSPLDASFPSITATSDETGRMRLTVEHSITGLIRLSDRMQGAVISDSILDSAGAEHALRGYSVSKTGPSATLSRVTVFGRVSVRELDASGVIFCDPVSVQQLQSGGVRFSYVPPDSTTPRRYRCQPDLALEVSGPEAAGSVYGRLVPVFTSTRYGDPAYCQLSLLCPPEIRTGTEDGAEMGAFHELLQPQRERNLRIRLQEYLPVGREATLIFVT